MKPASAEMGVKIVRFQDRVELKSGEQMKFFDLFFMESQLRLIMNMFLSIECIWSFFEARQKVAFPMISSKRCLSVHNSTRSVIARWCISDISVECFRKALQELWTSEVKQVFGFDVLTGFDTIEKLLHETHSFSKVPAWPARLQFPAHPLWPLQFRTWLHVSITCALSPSNWKAILQATESLLQYQQSTNFFGTERFLLF